MGRYSKILLGPARKNDPQVAEGEATAAILPGTYVVLNASGQFSPAAAATTDKLYLAQENYLALRNVDTVYKAPVVGPPAVPGDRVIGLELEDDVIYAARVATGVNLARKGIPLAVGANGFLVLAAAGSRVVAFSDEIYNNTTGSAQLVQIRPAGSQSRQNP